MLADDLDIQVTTPITKAAVELFAVVANEGLGQYGFCLPRAFDPLLQFAAGLSETFNRTKATIQPRNQLTLALEELLAELSFISVPIPNPKLRLWEHPPFSGEERDPFQIVLPVDPYEQGADIYLMSALATIAALRETTASMLLLNIFLPDQEAACEESL